MQLTPEMVSALATAARQWHSAQRQYELTSRMFADAQHQLQLAERDLHELARGIELLTGAPVPAELVTSAAAPIGAVTMPIAQGPVVGATSDGVDAAAIVLQQMQALRMGTGGM